MTFFGFCTGFIAKKSKVKTKIALIHNFIPHEAKFYDKWMNKYFIKQFDAALVMSQKVEDDVKRISPKMKTLLLEHPNYTHFGEKIKKNEALNFLNISEEKKVLLFFGLIRDYKGLDTLINTLALLPVEYFLIIAGECYGDFTKYQNIISQNKLENQILVHNKFIHDDEVKFYFSAADVLILPYKEATQSGVIAISNYFCLPAIASNVGGLPEMIKQNEEGLITDENSARGFAETIKNYFSNELKSEFNLNLEKKKDHNSWTSFANQIEEFAKGLEKH
jgi:glycosyltransferase involved in cell wall biosynthesis